MGIHELIPEGPWDDKTEQIEDDRQRAQIAREAIALALTQ